MKSISSALIASLALLLGAASLFTVCHADPLRALGQTQAEQEEEDAYPKLLPLTFTDMVAFALASLGLMMAAGGGIGGGGILVPVYVLVLGFPPDHAVPLSNVTIFGGAIANILLNAPKRHPEADRPLVDWDLILIMEPLTLSGALIGAHLNVLLPDFVVILCLVALFTITGRQTWAKAKALHSKETQGWSKLVSEAEEGQEEGVVEMSSKSSAKAHLRRSSSAAPAPLPISSARRVRSSTDVARKTAAAEEEDDEEGTLSTATSSASNTTSTRALSQQPQRDPRVPRSLSMQFTATGGGGLLPDGADNEFTRGVERAALAASKSLNDVLFNHSMVSDTELALSDMLAEERSPRPKTVCIISGMFLCVLVLNIAKGGGGMKSPLGIHCPSPAFWFNELLIVAITVIVCFYARYYLLLKTRLKNYVGYEYLESDVRWDGRSTLINPALCTGAGVLAGLCGVGGGLVKAPLMLALGVNPQVASATSATMILFTTLTATTSFLVFGVLALDYAAAGMVLGFLATFVGQTIMSAVIKTTGRQSFIAFSIAVVVLVSAVAMTVEWFLSLFAHQGATHPSAKSFCGPRHH